MSDVDLQHVQQGFVNVDRTPRPCAAGSMVVYELDRFHHTGDVNQQQPGHAAGVLAHGAVSRAAPLGHRRGHRRYPAGVRPGLRGTGQFGGHRVGLPGHQQYLTLWISFRVFGFLLAMVSWVAPAVIVGGWRHPVYLAFAFHFPRVLLHGRYPGDPAGCHVLRLPRRSSCSRSGEGRLAQQGGHLLRSDPRDAVAGFACRTGRTIRVVDQGMGIRAQRRPAPGWIGRRGANSPMALPLAAAMCRDRCSRRPGHRSPVGDVNWSRSNRPPASCTCGRSMAGAGRSPTVPVPCP